MNYHNRFVRQEKGELLRDCTIAKEQLCFLFDLDFQVPSELIRANLNSWENMRRVDGVVRSPAVLPFNRPVSSSVFVCLLAEGKNTHISWCFRCAVLLG